METKQCTKCGTKWSLDNFPLQNKKLQKYKTQCKPCAAKTRKIHYQRNRKKERAQVKQWQSDNYEHLNRQRKEYRKTEKYKIWARAHDKKYRQTEQYKAWYKKYVIIAAINKKEHRAQNPEHYRAKSREGNRKRRSTISGKLEHTIRERIRHAIIKEFKGYSTLDLLGIHDIKIVRQYLESQFTKGMTWENQGKWHLDHILPISIFDLTNPIHQRIAFHYTNLQPLWAKDNHQKSDSIPPGFDFQKYITEKQIELNIYL